MNRIYLVMIFTLLTLSFRSTVPLVAVADTSHALNLKYSADIPHDQPLWRLDLPLDSYGLVQIAADHEGNFYLWGDGLLARIDTDGNVLWQENEPVNELAIGPQDEIYYSRGDHASLMKRDKEGNSVWEKKIVGFEFWDPVVDADDNVYLYLNKPQFGPSFIANYSSDGDELWRVNYPGVYADYSDRTLSYTLREKTTWFLRRNTDRTAPTNGP